MRKAKILNRLANILFVLLMIVVIPLSVPKFFGFSIYSVLSESMEPSIPTGSIIYVQDIENQKIKPKDIISFYSQGNIVVTHRIVKIENNLITTKGDNNKDIDLTKTHFSNVIGKITFSIPFFGYFYQTFGNISGITGLIIILVLIMVLWIYSYKLKKE